MEEKGAEALVALVRGEVDDAGAAGPPSSKTTAVLVEAAWCLRLLTEDLVVRRKVADTGAIEALVELAARSAPAREPDVVTERVLERVAWALRNLAKDKITRKRVAKAGGAAQLVALAARSTHRGEGGGHRPGMPPASARARPGGARCAPPGAVASLCWRLAHRPRARPCWRRGARRLARAGRSPPRVLALSEGL